MMSLIIYPRLLIYILILIHDRATLAFTTLCGGEMRLIRSFTRVKIAELLQLWWANLVIFEVVGRLIKINVAQGRGRERVWLISKTAILVLWGCEWWSRHGTQILLLMLEEDWVWTIRGNKHIRVPRWRLIVTAWTILGWSTLKVTTLVLVLSSCVVGEEGSWTDLRTPLGCIL